MAVRPDAKLDRKIVRTLAKFLADDGVLIGRWRMASKAVILMGSLLWALALFGYWQDAGGSWILAVLAGAGGLCLGLGLWFSTFVTQWPIVRPFIDAERVRQRTKEFDDQERR